MLLIILHCSCSEKISTKTDETKDYTSLKLKGSSTPPLPAEGTTVSSSLLTTTCKDNVSCHLNLTTQNVVTTPLPTAPSVNLTTQKWTTLTTQSSTNLTTTVAPIISPTLNSKLDDKQSSFNPKQKICICDLTVDYCDVNCCCDKDCSMEDKLVFGHCEKDFRHYDTRSCQYTKHIYINNTPHEFQINQDGLFCIVKSNLPPTYLVQRKDPLKTFHEIDLEKVNRYSWPTYKFKSVDEFPSADNYTFKKEMWILQHSRLEKFKLPKSLIATNCLIEENVRYLVDIENTCSHTDLSKENYHLKADTYFKNLSIIANPSLFNVSKYRINGVFQECPKNICVPISTQVCKQQFEDCIPINNTSLNMAASCHLSVLNNTFSCINLVRQVKYKLYHNGTNGIIKADLFIILQNTSYIFGEDIAFFQIMEVKFIWWNHILNVSSYLSGNPGYDAGKPILIANIIQVNVSITTSTNSSFSNGTQYKSELKLFRNAFDFTNNFLVLPFVDANGQCVLNTQKYTAIEFDYNLYLKCTIDEEITFHKNLSVEKICAKVQQTIFKYWPLNATNDTLYNIVVGQFGNANVNNVHDWLNIMFKDDLQGIMKSVSGDFDNKTNTLICKNITTLLKIDIFYARVDFNDVINQQKILAVTFLFDHLRNIDFSYDLTKTYVNLKIRLDTQVTFLDITTKKIRKTVDPPSLNIRLPRDFFYPFVKIGNYAVKQLISNGLLIFSIVVQFK